MADASPVSGDDLKRAEKFARESFVLEGEDAATALAENSPRRTALEIALREIDSGRSEPSVEWRREFSLMLGLERLLAEDEPHLADGTTLSAHQVDALSGTLIALESELLIGRNGRGSASMEELHSGEVRTPDAPTTRTSMGAAVGESPSPRASNVMLD